MLKAYKYMSEIIPVTHIHKDPADGNRKLSKMDISLLEEQYSGIKQMQKFQTHIIVFKAGTWHDQRSLLVYCYSSVSH